MRTITVAEVRQNPTEAFRQVEEGESYIVTRHGRPIATLAPYSVSPLRVARPARRRGPVELPDRPPHVLRTASSVDELLDDLKSDW